MAGLDVARSTELPSEATIEAQGHEDRRRWSWTPTASPAVFWLASAATIVIAGIILRIITSGSFYLSDDYLYLMESADSKYTIKFLRRDNFGHFAPITRSLYFFYERHFGLNYLAGNLLCVALLCLIGLNLVFLLRFLNGTNLLIPVGAAMFVLSAFSIRVGLWFGASLHVFNALLFSLLTVTFFVQYCLAGKRRYVAISLACFVVALLIQERPLLVPLYLVLFRYVVLPPEPLRARQQLRKVWGDALLWLPYLVLWTLSLANLLIFYPDNVPKPTISQAISFVGRTFFRYFIPGMFGLMEGSPGTAHTALTVLAYVLFFGLIVWSIASRPRAWRAWAFFAAGYVANMGLLAWGREGLYGAAQVSRDLQYYPDVAVLFVLSLALAYRYPRRVAAHHRTARRTFPLVVGAFAVVGMIAANLVVSDGNLVTQNSPAASEARHYVSGITSGFNAIRKERRVVDLLPLKVPSGVLPTFLGGYTRQAEFLKLFRLPPESPDSADKVVIDDKGQVVSVRRDVVISVNLYQAWRAGTLAISGVVPSSDSAPTTGVCVDLGPGQPAGLDLTLPNELTAGTNFVGIGYRSDLAWSPIYATRVTSAVTWNLAPTPLPAGSHTVYDAAPPGSARHLMVGLATGSHSCVTSLTVVRLVAVSPSGSGCYAFDDYGHLGQPAACGEDWTYGQRAVTG